MDRIGYSVHLYPVHYANDQAIFYVSVTVTRDAQNVVKKDLIIGIASYPFSLDLS